MTTGTQPEAAAAANTPGVPRLLDMEPPPADLRAEVVAGLQGRLPEAEGHSPAKRIPPKWLYDERGSLLFEAITALPEYYPTRTELAILGQHGDAMARCVGPGPLVVEYGSGSGVKTRLLLRMLDEPVAYVPIDISCDAMMSSATALAAEFPAIEVLPVCADFTRPLELPRPQRTPARTLIYYPGSTIGNFLPANAIDFLCVARAEAGADGALLIGVDLLKDPAVLLPAYDDERGITAAFNKNLLVRLNRELGTDFDLDAFRHRAVWHELPETPGRGRIEMHLVSQVAQKVRVGDMEVEFAADEPLVTEYSYKYTAEAFGSLAAQAGWAQRAVWTDPDGLFSVQLLEPNAAGAL